MSALVVQSVSVPSSREAAGERVFSTRAVNVALTVLGAAMLVLTLKGRHDVNWGRMNSFLAGAFGLAVPYFLASWIVWRARAARSTLWIVLGFAALFRLGPLHTDVYLSTDPYRYVWDGRVQAHGINPFRYVPSDPHLEFLQDRKIYPHINRRTYARTLYPPVAQWVFYVLTRFGENIRHVRATMVICEALTAWFLVLLLRDHGLPAQRVLLYAWQPLCIWEFASGGHCDAIMLATVALTLLLHRHDRPLATGAALGLAVMAKLFPLVLFPALWRRWRWDWRMPTAFAATIFLGYLPYAATYSVRGALGFLPAYTAEEGIQNGDRFYFLNMLPSGFLLAHGVTPYRVFVALVLALFAAVAAWAYWKPPVDERSDLRRCACVAALAMGTLSPAVDWYFTWLVVFLPFLGDAWLAWIPTASFVLYYNWGFMHADEIFLQNSAIFLPALGLWAVPAALRWYRRRTGATGARSPGLADAVPVLASTPAPV